MYHGKELKFYPKKDEKHSKGFGHRREVARCLAVQRMDWEGPDWGRETS